MIAAGHFDVAMFEHEFGAEFRHLIGERNDALGIRVRLGVSSSPTLVERETEGRNHEDKNDGDDFEAATGAFGGLIRGTPTTALGDRRIGFFRHKFSDGLRGWWCLRGRRRISRRPGRA